MNIYEKLIEVRKSVPYLKKENEGFQYKYVSSSQVLGNLKQKMDEVGLLLIPQITDARFTDILRGKNSKGNDTVDLLTELEIEFTWINAEKPEETVICKWYGQGLDTTGEKGVGKALTYAEKYFMLKFFNIPTDKLDPDAFQNKHDKAKDESETIFKELANNNPALDNICPKCSKKTTQGALDKFGMCSSCKQQETKEKAA